MTERELSHAVHLKAELDALRRVAAEESSADVLAAIDRQARAVESARLESWRSRQRCQTRASGL